MGNRAWATRYSHNTQTEVKLFPGDVVAVLPHEGRNDPDRIDGSPKFYWCLYSEG